MNVLTDEQQTVVDVISKMQGRDRLVVSGRAGSGKTFAIANAVTGRKVLFLTPTHAARTVLEQEGELNDKYHTVMTIHRAIGWYKGRDQNLEAVEGYRPAKKEKHGLTNFDRKGSSPFAKVDLIIVDECSMVGSFLFGAIEEYAEQNNLPVVYSGDRFQLPPVRDHEVITQQGFPTITLRNSMRFAENSDIYRFGEVLRHAIENCPKEDPPFLYGGEGVQVVPCGTWLDGLKEGYASGDDLLAVTSNNKALRRLRKAVRQVDHDQFCPGDKVMSKKTDESFLNGEQFTILQVERDVRVLPSVPGCVSGNHELRLAGYKLSFEGTSKTAFVLDRDEEARNLKERVKRLYQKGKLTHEEGCRILDWVDEINCFELSALATVHKSQGRTVDTIYIDTRTVLCKPDWLSSVDHLHLLYTAVTRARAQVVFYEMPMYCEARTN
ncbi:AAA family ATPase, partial [Shimia thalassica]|uniref:ATP-dependent DNA helicase n=1 Tax=Shimia thalassica TaxID=1715693 RepID=UPI0026E4765F